MQIEQLQFALGGLVLVLLALLLFAFRSRLGMPSLPRPALPAIPRPRKSSKKQAEPEVQLSSERLARLRYEPASEPEHSPVEQAACEQPALGDPGLIEPLLEEAFNLFEAGTIDMAGYEERLDAIDQTVRDLERGASQSDQGELTNAREAVDWCKRWVSEFKQTEEREQRG